MKDIPLALAYDDVLIVPKRSSLTSRAQALTTTRLTKKIPLHIPIVSANMETITESDMAIALARLGGVGVIHRFMSIEDNVEEIKRVKRAQNFVIEDPYTIGPNKTIRDAKAFIRTHGVSGLLVAHEDKKLLGVLSSRDILFASGDELTVSEVMTPRNRLVTRTGPITLNDARALLTKEKIEKIPLLDDSDRITGLITSADIEHSIRYPNACSDDRGRLIVGGAIGVHGDYLDRAQELVKAEVDVLVVDIAHGHSDMMFAAIGHLREHVGATQLIVGNIATPDAARELCQAGVDAIKVGVGPGATCITRVVTGCGVPQLTAVLGIAEIAQEYGVPLIADGGIQHGGDIVKALGAGADSVMIGSLFGGTAESPGVVMMREGKKYKVHRGSASFAVAHRRKNLDPEKKDLENVTPEGVESIVPYKGAVEEIINQLMGGVRSGMSYTNSRTISELQKNVEFVRMTDAGRRESGSHDLELT